MLNHFFVLSLLIVLPTYVFSSGHVSIHTCGTYAGSNMLYQVKAPLLLFNPVQHPIACLRFKGDNIVVDGMGASIICAAPKCTSKAIDTNSTNVFITNLKLVGTAGILAAGDNITIDSIKVMTVHSNPLEVRAVTAAVLRNNHIVNAIEGGVVVKISSNSNNNSKVVIEDNFFVGVHNPVYVVGSGITLVSIYRNNIVDSMGDHVIAVKGEDNGNVEVVDNFIGAFSGEEGIVANGESTLIIENQFLDCNISSEASAPVNATGIEQPLVPLRVGEVSIADVGNNTFMGLGSSIYEDFIHANKYLENVIIPYTHQLFSFLY